MPILLPYLTPTTGMPQPVIASSKSRRPGYNPRRIGMAQEDFYEAPLETVVTPEFQRPDPERDFIHKPQTSDFLQEQLQRFAERAAPPELLPSARIKSPASELVQPSSFQEYYNQLKLITQQGNEQLSAAQASAQFRRNQQVHNILNQVSQSSDNHNHYNENYQGKWNLGRVLPHVAQAAQEVGSKFGVGTIHGVGSRPNKSYHPVGRALDFMTGNDIAKGQAITNYITQNWSRLGVIEIIWNGRYSNRPGHWVPYRGPNPHKDHPHVSFRG